MQQGWSPGVFGMQPDPSYAHPTTGLPWGSPAITSGSYNSNHSSVAKFRALEKTDEVLRYDPACKKDTRSGCARFTSDVMEYLRYVKTRMPSAPGVSDSDRAQFLIKGTTTGLQERLQRRLTLDLDGLTQFAACEALLLKQSTAVGSGGDYLRASFRTLRMDTAASAADTAYAAFKESWYSYKSQIEETSGTALWHGSPHEVAMEIQTHVLPRVSPSLRAAYEDVAATSMELTTRLSEDLFWGTLDLVAHRLRVDTPQRTRFQAFEDRPRVEPARERTRRETTPGPEKEVCEACGGMGHVAEECPNKNVECYRCHELGHHSRNCPNGSQRGRGKSSDRDDKSRDSSRESGYGRRDDRRDRERRTPDRGDRRGRSDSYSRRDDRRGRDRSRNKDYRGRSTDRLEETLPKLFNMLVAHAASAASQPARKRSASRESGHGAAPSEAPSAQSPQGKQKSESVKLSGWSKNK